MQIKTHKFALAATITAAIAYAINLVLIYILLKTPSTIAPIELLKRIGSNFVSTELLSVHGFLMIGAGLLMVYILAFIFASIYNYLIEE